MHALRPTKEEKRERILAKADELFREFGAAKTTVADIARELGMSPANVYKFFPSRKAILEACAVRNLGVIKRQVAELVAGGGGAMDRIRGVVLAVNRFNEELFRNERQIFRLVMTAAEEDWEGVRKHHDFLLETMTQLLGEGASNGEFPGDQPPGTPCALLDCLSAALRPHLQPACKRIADEDRVRAQIDLLAKALATP